MVIQNRNDRLDGLMGLLFRHPTIQNSYGDAKGVQGVSFIGVKMMNYQLGSFRRRGSYSPSEVLVQCSYLLISKGEPRVAREPDECKREVWGPILRGEVPGSSGE